MAVQILVKDDTYVLNQCAKYLARNNTDPRHNFGQFDPGDIRSRICESWRFPIVDVYSDGVNFESTYAQNEVTFVYAHEGSTPPQQISVVGTFSNLYEPIPLRQVGDSKYFTVTVLVPKGEIHTYKFILDGAAIVDPINPQRVTLDNGKVWSRFFTFLCTTPLTLEQWERDLLARLTYHVLPFRTKDAQDFLNRYYYGLDRQAKDTQFIHAYRLDEPVGAVSFIDNLLAREENHHLIDYKICLTMISEILRKRNPFVELTLMPATMYEDLYKEMATGNVNGWDYNRYSEPRYFLQLLRRHTYTGAFSHPRYGGNIGASGWAYLEETFRDQNGKSAFDWRKALEIPLGGNADYHG